MRETGQSDLKHCQDLCFYVLFSTRKVSLVEMKKQAVCVLFFLFSAIDQFEEENWIEAIDCSAKPNIDRNTQGCCK